MASAKVQQRMSKTGKQKSAAREAKSSDVPDEIQCKICKKRYEDPKLLPCLHTFCKACLEESLETHSGVLYCPVCPREIGSQFSDVEKLPNNFMVSNLLQAIDLKQGLSSKQCDSCDEGVTATSRCYECSDFLCANCVEAHKRVRFTKNHKVVAMKNLSADEMVNTPTCASHSQEALKMYCKQCKKPVCRTCIRTEHDEHVLVSLKEAMDDTKPKLNALLVATRAKIPLLQRQLKGVHAAKEKLETKVDDVIKEIQATSAKILMAVKRREKDLYKTLRRIHDQKSDMLESREVALENDLAQVLDCCDFAEELGKNGNEGMVLHASEMTCTRLKELSNGEDEALPEISDDEIEYVVDEKPVLDQMKIYGKILSKEKKAKQEKEGKKNDERKERNGEKEKDKKQETTEEGKATLERRTSWLQTLANPRALIRRLSFGGDEMEDKKPDEKSGSKDQETRHATESNRTDSGGQTPQETQPKDDSGQQQQQVNTSENNSRQRAGSVPTSKTKEEQQHIYAVPNKPNQQSTHDPSKSPQIPSKSPYDPSKSPHDPSKSPHDPSKSTHEPRKSPPKPPRAFQVAKTAPNEPEAVSSSSDPNAPPPDVPPRTVHEYESPQTQSILKQSSPHDNTEQGQQPTDLAQAWTVRGGTVPSGANSQSYLPSLCILTKNRRGRPREVEIQLESPDNSIVSAQILDHKNGTYTIFFCPLTTGEHNLYVNVGGKNIKHGKRVLNFYGKFSGMGAEELFLARRALSCIRWQVTPGFVELKDKKLKPNPDI